MMVPIRQTVFIVSHLIFPPHDYKFQHEMKLPLKPFF